MPLDTVVVEFTDTEIKTIEWALTVADCIVKQKFSYITAKTIPFFSCVDQLCDDEGQIYDKQRFMIKTTEHCSAFVATQLRTFPYVAEDTLEITKIHEGYELQARFAVPFSTAALRKYFSDEQIVNSQEIKCQLAYLEDVRRAIDRFSSYKFIRPDVPDPFLKITFSEKDMPEQAQMT